jgi:hypothetical protein
LPDRPDLETQLKQVIAATDEQLRNDIHRFHRQERMVAWGTLAVFLVILLLNAALLIRPHQWAVELMAIWLPSLVSAAPAYNFRRRVTQRVDIMEEFAMQLRFVNLRLFETLPPAATADEQQAFRTDNLRLLCRVAAQYNQSELAFALANSPPFPV